MSVCVKLCRRLQVLLVHRVPHTQSFYHHRIQRTLHVPQPASADHAQRTGEAADVYALLYSFSYNETFCAAVCAC